MNKDNTNTETVRINKYLADHGYCSRREADSLIEQGQVKVNGKKAVIGQRISSTDKVQLLNKEALPKKQYYAYYKGRGIITHSPGEGEVDIESRIAKDYGLKGVYPVGRLDKDSEGLIILTDDGRVTTKLLNSEQQHNREYVVTVDKPMKGAVLMQLENGVNIEGYKTKPAKATMHKNHHNFSIVLTEGKKHQIRRMCAAVGYQVQGLKRLKIDNIALGALKPNQYRKIVGQELSDFLSSLELK